MQDADDTADSLDILYKELKQRMSTQNSQVLRSMGRPTSGSPSRCQAFVRYATKRFEDGCELSGEHHPTVEDQLHPTQDVPADPIDRLGASGREQCSSVLLCSLAKLSIMPGASCFGEK